MNDSDFLASFEACTLPPSEFTHRGHIRMAWLVLRRDGWEQGSAAIREGIQRYARTLGATTKYHETITLFWAWLVHTHIEEAPHLNDFDSFAAAFPALLDSGIIRQHYSRDLLSSDETRHTWVEPDLMPMPTH